ncbi:MAG: hypothetical protein Q7U97_12995 [Rhodocyclaceae bacterium]|nr:hypothetical protein [Rhodocyclaceae bacterium]
MADEIDKLEATPLTDEALRRVMPTTPIWLWSDLQHVKHADDLFDDGRAIIYLYSSPTFGHWLGLCLVPDHDGDGVRDVEAFDSYSGWPGDELANVPASVRKQMGQTADFLAKLLFDPKSNRRNVVLNGTRLQRVSPDVQTCARWVALRLAHNDKTAEDFAAFVASHLSPELSDLDEVVVSLTRAMDPLPLPT